MQSEQLLYVYLLVVVLFLYVPFKEHMVMSGRSVHLTIVFLGIPGCLRSGLSWFNWWVYFLILDLILISMFLR